MSELFSETDAFEINSRTIRKQLVKIKSAISAQKTEDKQPCIGIRPQQC